MSTSTPLAPSGPDDGDVLARQESEPRTRTLGEGWTGREVVVGVDGSECGLTAVRWATEEAARRDAPLRIVHAAPYLGRRDVSGPVPPPELPRARRITAQAYTLARHTEPGVRADTEVVPGDPTAVLLRASSECQLVVLGISTTGAPDEMVLAPVPQRVAARATTPVVVVPRPHGAEPAGRPVVAVLGLGDHADDEPVLAYAADAARRSDARLRVVRARSRRSTGGPPPDESGLTSRADLEDIVVEERQLPGGAPGDVLTAAAHTPLLVISSGHGGFLHRTLDAPHRWLLRHCTSPMALVPPARRPELEPREEIIAVG
ncbi:universal stress protein [Geodermatophilus sp. YIM 151500]|uniref:universal stress protein n=1 Tax=Geodermatophilus sp. YIM 151500 TaxID=2984531 RepID=UPI0021E382EF|nr:universal stress protein [Geodermatophilus sp. YIM 151500]MCV2489684.1 universal stress protein [Geodermatophilus sp. YIM 151500]